MKGRALLLGLLRLPFTGAQPATAETSKDARPTLTKAARDRYAVLAYIDAQGERGATDEEIQHALSMAGDTERPRRIELARAGCIEGRDGATRATQSGKQAVIWYFVKGLPHAE